MSLSTEKNIGAYISTIYAGDPDIESGGAGNNVLVNGTVVDRFAVGIPRSVAVAYAIKATLALGDTLSLAYSLQHGSDGVNFTDFAPVAASVVLTGVTGGAAQTKVIKHSVDLNGAMRYVRVAYTPTLSVPSTDSAEITPVFVFGGEPELPAV